MNNFESVKEYFINIDFDIVEDSDLLNNVYEEIKGFEEKLILNIESVSNFEILVKKSNLSQITNLCKKINLHFLSLKKTGSKFVEVIFELLSGFKNNIIPKSVFEPFIENFKELCSDKNGTHVLRKFLICFYNKNNDEIRDFKQEITEILENEISVDTLITITQYLKLKYSKHIVRLIYRKFITPEIVTNKMYTYIFEDLINISDEKSLNILLEKIKPEFKNFINDKFGVFLVLSLIKKYPQENDFYFSQCEVGMKNNNVILKVAENYCKLKDFKKVKKILKTFYDLESDVFKGLLLNFTESPDTKYVNFVVLLMDCDLFSVNEDFIKYFKPEWVHRKFGLSLLKGFLEGGASNKLKINFARESSLSGGLNKKKEGKQIMKLIKSYKKLH